MLLHARAFCNCSRELLEWAAQEARDVRLLRHPLACSWRSLSTCNTTKAVALSLYIGERAARARTLGSHCSWFLSRFASLFRHAFRLCRRSAIVSVGALLSSLPALPLCFVSPDLAFCTRLCYRLYSRLSHYCLGYVSRSLRALLHRQQIYICNMYEHFNQLIELASFLACLLTIVIG